MMVKTAPLRATDLHSPVGKSPLYVIAIPSDGSASPPPRIAPAGRPIVKKRVAAAALSLQRIRASAGSAWGCTTGATSAPKRSRPAFEVVLEKRKGSYM